MSRIDGLSDLMRQFQAIGGMDGEMEKSVRKWTEYVRGEAVDLCPVDTGELRQSIRATVETGDTVEGIVYTNKEYAPDVEFGTGIRGAATHDPDEYSGGYSQSIRGQAAQPFMYPALNNNEDRIVKGMKEDLARAIGEAVNG